MKKDGLKEVFKEIFGDLSVIKEIFPILSWIIITFIMIFGMAFLAIKIRGNYDAAKSYRDTETILRNAIYTERQATGSGNKGH
jgi:hypothetical protein